MQQVDTRSALTVSFQIRRWHGEDRRGFVVADCESCQSGQLHVDREEDLAPPIYAVRIRNSIPTVVILASNRIQPSDVAIEAKDRMRSRY